MTNFSFWFLTFLREGPLAAIAAPHVYKKLDYTPRRVITNEYICTYPLYFIFFPCLTLFPSQNICVILRVSECCVFLLIIKYSLNEQATIVAGPPP